MMISGLSTHPHPRSDQRTEPSAYHRPTGRNLRPPAASYHRSDPTVGHSDAMAFLKLVVKRLAAQRLMALALLVTMAFSIGVLVAGPIYANASQQAILSGQLAQSPVQAKNARFVVFSGEGFDEAATDTAIRAAARGLPVARVIRLTETLSATVGGPTGSVQAPVAYRDGAFGHIKLDGRAPKAADEVAISAGVSLGVGANPGDTLFLRNDAKGPVVALHVTAVFNPPPANDFWFGGGTIFPQNGSSQLSPLMVTKPGYDAVSQRLGLVGQFTWDMYLNLSVKNFNQIQALPGQ